MPAYFTHGWRHDGDGFRRAARHIRGGQDGAAILAMDSYRSTDGVLFLTQQMFRDHVCTSAEVKALRATPAVLVQAPGAGFYLEFCRLDLMLDYGGTNVFTESTYNLAVRYTNGSGAIVSQTIETTGFIDQSADTYTCGLPKIDAIVAAASIANAALVLHNTAGAEIAGNAAGDNVLRLRTFYIVHQVLA